MRGETVGKYKVEDVLGEGGMGTVYRAVHTGIGKRAAVKVLRNAYSDSEEVVQRFFNEARAAARIEHPGIIDVYDFGRHNGSAYLIMELLDGEPLSARLARGRIPPDELRRIGTQIADALAAAHDRGIAHRDLKPDNVFLVPDRAVDGGTRVKLLDFGIAKLVEPDGTSSVETRTGAVIGTPVYMSPEQCRGTGEVDHRADLYSLGCMLFQMVTGRPPFERAGVGELISAHLTEPPPPVDAIRADVEPDLAALIMRLLAKSPGDRLDSARQVIDALTGTTTVDRPPARTGAPEPGAHLATMLPGDTDRTDNTKDADTNTDPVATAETAYQSQEHPSTLSGAASEKPGASEGPPSKTPWLIGAVLVAAAGAAAFTLYSRSASNDAERPTASPPPAVVADAAPALAEPALGLKFLDGYRNVSGSAATPYASPGGWNSAARDFEAAAAQPGAPVRWKAAAELSRGYEFITSGKTEQSLAAMKRAAELEPAWDLAKLGLGRALSKSGDHEAALEQTRAAERLSPDWWLPIAESAGIQRSAGNLEQAVEEYQRALTMKPGEPLLLSGLAIIYHAMRMDKAAASYAEKALAIDPDMLSARLLLAERALEKADGKTALEHAERILAHQPRSANAKLAQADALLLLKKKDDARAAYRRAIELADELEQEGGPEARLDAVRKALSKNKLPRARHKKKRWGPRDRSRKSKPDRSRNTINSPVYLDL